MSTLEPWPWLPSETGTAPYASFRILETYERAADSTNHVDTVRHRVSRALDEFPELAGRTVNVGRLDTWKDEDEIGGQAWPRNMMITFPTDRYASWQTVYHELAHLAIYLLDERGEDVSEGSEEFCSIFAVARMPKRTIKRDERGDIAYLGTPEVRQERWPEVCRDSLRYREERGPRSHYIKKCKEWLGVRP